MCRLFFEEDCKGYKNKNMQYFAVYRDLSGKEFSTEVSKEIYDAIEDFRKYEKRQRNIDDRYFKPEKFNMGRKKYKNASSAPSAEDAFFFEDFKRECDRDTDSKLAKIMKVFESCTATQKRRFIKYAIKNMTLSELAKQENCSRQSIYESIRQVSAKIKKKM